MVETVPFDVILSLAVGLSVAWTAQVHLAAAPRLVPSRPLWAVVLFQGLIFCPVGAYLIIVHPAWSWNYLFNPAHVPGWLPPVAIGAYAVAGIAGFLWGGHLVRTDRTRQLGRIVLGVLGVLGLYLGSSPGSSGGWAATPPGRPGTRGCRGCPSRASASPSPGWGQSSSASSAGSSSASGATAGASSQPNPGTLEDSMGKPGGDS